MITTPRQWISGEFAQVCITLTTPASAGDILSLDVETIPPRYRGEEIDNKTETVLKTDIQIDQGKCLH